MELPDDPSAVTQVNPPYAFARNGDHYEIQLRVPFTEKSEIGLFKKDDELVVEIGTVRRHVGLPTSMATLEPTTRSAGKEYIGGGNEEGSMNGASNMPRCPAVRAARLPETPTTPVRPRATHSGS